MVQSRPLIRRATWRRYAEREVRNLQFLFEASCAVEVYDKAVRWAAEHVDNSLFRFVGVEHISDIGGEQPGDGTEIGGAFFDDEHVWERKDELIPEKSKITAIMWEQNRDVPIGELMTEKPEKSLMKIEPLKRMVRCFMVLRDKTHAGIDVNAIRRP